VRQIGGLHAMAEAARVTAQPGFSLTCRQNPLQEFSVERDRFMTGCFRAPVCICRPDIVSGEGSLFSPEFKTRATKTTTKTV